MRVSPFWILSNTKWLWEFPPPLLNSCRSLFSHQLKIVYVMLCFPCIVLGPSGERSLLAMVMERNETPAFKEDDISIVPPTISAFSQFSWTHWAQDNARGNSIFHCTFIKPPDILTMATYQILFANIRQRVIAPKYPYVNTFKNLYSPIWTFS